MTQVDPDPLDPVSERSALEIAFRPRSVAVAGVSADKGPWEGGNMFLRTMQRLGQVPHIYAVNPKGGEFSDGTPIYRTLHEIPGDVEYLISAVPAGAALDLVADAVSKEVRLIHFFTAGFRETGDAQRIELEQQVVERARAGGIRLIGPNCLGMYSPIGGTGWRAEASREVGRIGVVSQSGLNASELVARGAQRALRFSYVASFGNATDLNESDFLEHFAEDPDTDIVLTYLEGVKDGPRFLRVARRLAMRKPLVVLKGGVTEAGSRATVSHTGTLAGSAAVWGAVSRQAGFINVLSVDELLDLAVTIQCIPQVAGPRVAIVGGGGGASVLAADACDRMGLKVPWLTAETQRRLAELTPVAGTSVRNPVDTTVMWREEGLAGTLKVVAGDPNVDLMFVHFDLDSLSWRNRDRDEHTEEQLLTSLRSARSAMEKPIALVVRPPDSAAGRGVGTRMLDQLGDDGFAIYPSIEQASLALRRYLDWQARRPASAAK